MNGLRSRSTLNTSETQHLSVSDSVPDHERTELARGLNRRHMQMIAIGGAIGTGLFVASGATASTAGPGGALVAYAAVGVMVLLVMQSLSEKSAHMPLVGNYQTYTSRLISPSFGFARWVELLV